MVYPRYVAATVALVHATFVLFVALGALLVWHWPRVAWVHVPAVVWAAWIEMSGGVCPLTPIEQDWRAREGVLPYEGDFIATWIFPWLYPEGLTREAQVVLGAGAILANGTIYWIRFRRPAKGEPSAVRSRRR